MSLTNNVTKTEVRILSILVLIATISLVGAASATTLTAGSAQVTSIGNTATVDLVLDEVPAGLSGYNVTVDLINDAGVGTITGVTYPSWVEIKSNSTWPTDKGFIKGSALSAAVADGSTNVNLATITLQGLAEGSSTVNVSIAKMSDGDGSNMIASTTIVQGTFAVVLPAVTPVAAFTSDVTTGTAPLTVTFTDTSTHVPTSWAWDFGDGSTENATARNPVHTFATAGTYTVKLTATNAAGSDDETMTDYITVNAPGQFVNPGFETGDLSGWTVGSKTLISSTTKHSGSYAARFTSGTGGSQATDFLLQDVDLTGVVGIRFWGFKEWSAGDCYVYIDDVLVQSPTAVSNTWTRYTVPTAYTGTHTVAVKWDGSGENAFDIDDFSTVKTGENSAPVADAQSVSTNKNTAKDITLTATDAESDPLTYAISTAPAHGTLGTVSTTGVVTYTPATDYVGSDSFTFTVNDQLVDSAPATVSIEVKADPPVASFTAVPDSGVTPLTVKFTDTSTGIPTSWAWDFNGDGVTDSTAQSPLHTYTTGGTFLAKLNVSNTAGSSEATQTITVTAAIAPVAAFTTDKNSGPAPLTVQFTDTTTNSPTWWSWNFGDHTSNIYVTDTTNSVVYVIYPNNTVGTLSTGISKPRGITLDDQGNIYIGRGDTTASPLYKILPDGTVTTLSDGIKGMYNLAVDHSGNVYVGDVGNKLVYKVYPDGTKQALGSGFTKITGVAVSPDGNVYVADQTNKKIYKILQDGTQETIYSTTTASLSPQSLAVDHDNNVYFGTSTKVFKIYQTGTQVELATGLNTVYCLAVDDFTGNLYASSYGSHKAVVIYPDGTWTTLGNDYSFPQIYGIAIQPADSFAQNPTHTYTKPGPYDVSLIAANGGGSNVLTQTGSITVDAITPVAAFTSDVQSGTAPLTVTFTDASMNTPTSWAWDFGDGSTENATVQNPVHTFASAGTYTVKLTATNAAGSDDETMTDYITVAVPAAPVAAFSSDVQTGTAPLTVTFTDASTNVPTSWAWDFGDSSTENATVQNPVHTFASAGKYTVKLTATNAGGSDDETMTDYITVSSAVVTPVAAFTSDVQTGTAPLTVTFTDVSTNAPTSWAWDFGDSSTENATVQNPVHTFASAGTYTVKLTATNAAGSDDETMTDYITVSTAVIVPVAAFSSDVQTGTAPLTVTFTDVSTNTPTLWAWDFGDSSTENATVQNPVHTFASAGKYTVKLTATNAGGSDDETMTDYITVSAAVVAPVAAFSSDVQTGTAPLTVTFTDKSTNTPTSWAWDFGDSSTENATVQNPVHTFANAGTYTVKLTATNTAGSDDETMTGYITVVTAGEFNNPGFETGNLNGWITGSYTSITSTKHTGTYAAHFDWTGSNATNFIRQDVDLTGMESIFFWGYGEGSTSKFYVYIDDVLVKAPSAVSNTWTRYTIPASSTGIHTVTITWPGGYGADVDDFSMNAIGTNTAPVADAQSVSTGNTEVKSITLTATDANNDPLTYTVVASPLHGSLIGTAPYLTYAPTAGYVGTDSFTFTVNDGLVDSAPAIVDITVTESAVTPVAGFSAVPTSGDVPLPVQFTDTSSNTPTSWRWDFGDSPASVYVVDGGAYVVQEIYPDGTTRSIGTGSLSQPQGVAVDAQGNVYIADWDFTQPAMKISPEGTATKLGSGFSSSIGIAVDADGNAYVGSYGSSGVYKIYPDGTTVKVGSGYGQPFGVDVDSQGNVYVADGSAVWKIYPDGTTVQVTSCTGPWDISVDHEGNVYEACYDGGVVQKVSPGGGVVSVGSGFSNPSGVAVDDFSGNVYVTDATTSTLYVVYPSGETVPLKSGYSYLVGVAVKPADSYSQHPAHTYTEAGTYTVSLIASNSAGNGIQKQSDLITVNAAAVAPVAAFSSDVQTGTAPLTVTFADASTNTPTSWAWDFGDGSTENATVQNPVHTFASAGKYTVKLTATNAGGSDDETMTDYITVSAAVIAPVAGFSSDVHSGTAPLTITFTDQSTNTPTSWAWDFGDSSTENATVQNPVHTFANAGTYTVKLTATNVAGSDDETMTDYVTVSAPVLTPVADFSASTTSGAVPLFVRFNDTSTGSPTSWSWNFGDGGTSPDQNTTHTYMAEGTYTVTLTATNAVGSDSEEKIGLITVTAPTETGAGLGDTAKPKFQQDVKNTGRSPFTGPQTNSVKWIYSTGGQFQYSSPVIGSDGTIYSGNYVDNKLYAINPDGTLKWTYLSDAKIAGTPAIGSDGTIYFGNYVTTRSTPEKFYAINPDGTLKWSYLTGGPILASPTIASDGTIYSGNYGDGKLYAFNPDGTLKWSFTTTGATYFYDTPVIANDGTLYFGNYQDKSLYALNPDGSLKWSYNIGVTFGSSSPALGSDGTIYIGAGDKRLYAFNPDGTIKWSYLFPSSVMATPAIGADGTIYIGNYDKNLYALNPDGTLKWTYLTSQSVYSAATIGSDGTVYFGNYVASGSGDRNIYALNPDGALKWSYLVGTTTSGNIQNAPSIGSDGTLYVGSVGGNIYAFHDPITPVAAFSSDVQTGTAPLTVTFTDQSTNAPTSWSWDFGDSSTENATVKNPVHTFANAGTYTVKLTATNTAGSDDETMKDYVTVSAPVLTPVAAFSSDIQSGTAPLTVTFTDASTNAPTSWAWDFGDSSTENATVQNPVHTFATAGTYTVKLTATNAAGSDDETTTDYITVSAAVIAPVADFSASTTNGVVPLFVSFTDASTNTPASWAWSFGDGSTSTDPSPTHTYAAAGTYTVKLTATNAGGSDSEEKTGYITVTETSSGGAMESNRHIFIGVANDAGVKYNLDGAVYGSGNNNTYYIKSDSGGLNEIHLSTSSSNAKGQVTDTTTATTDSSGTFYVTNTGPAGVTDDIVLLVAVNGTIPDDFSMTIRSSGYTWTPTTVIDAAPSDITRTEGAVEETFTKADLRYGPQTWKPGPGALGDLPLYYGQNQADGQTYQLMFIDLKTGALNSTVFPSLTDNGAAKVEYSFHNMPARAAFNAYGWRQAANQGQGISWTNKVTGTGSSGYAIQYTPVIAPVAAFSADVQTGTAPLTVTFKDASTNAPTSWAWDFGDSSTENATVQNPVHTFATAGKYTVKLTATNAAGSDDETMTDYITASSAVIAPVAGFSSDVQTGTAPLTVTFTDASTNTPTSWAWDFGDSSAENATVQNPVHTFAAAGTYTVKLTATNTAGSDDETMTNYVTVSEAPVAPVAGFSAVSTYLSVQFTDASTGTAPLTYAWDFGDGTTSIQQNPEHTYAAAGTYTVKLTVTNIAGSDDETKSVTVSAAPVTPIAAFTAVPTDLTVTFTDASTGTAPLTYAWDFGDGTTSIQQNPEHAYAAAGTYTVKLTVTNIAGSDDETKSVTVSAAPVAPLAAFTATPTYLSVAFTDASTGTAPLTYAWDFGDGTTSIQQNPEHAYAAAGTYTVKLTVTNIAGSDDETKSITVTGGSPTVLNAAFTADVTTGQSPLKVTFTDQSTGSPTSWYWSFGDGTTSTKQNPTHTYMSRKGATYTVTLYVLNANGRDTETKVKYITVTAPEAPVAAFTADVTTGQSPLKVTFTDQSTGSPTAWYWSFGDGTTSTKQNPDHTYTTLKDRSYTVTLTVVNANGRDTETKAQYIAVTAGSAGTKPAAAFTADVTTGQSPLKVTFTDQSTGSPTAWYWTFGDGTTSTKQNPDHTYTSLNDRSYTVTLMVVNANGRDTETKTQYITVTAGSAGTKPEAAFTADVTTGPSPLKVTFTDQSTGSPTAWYWTFGDGTTSTKQNPDHTYTSLNDRSYTVTLTVVNANGRDTETKTQYIAVTAGSAGTKPEAAFTADVTTGQSPLKVTFTDQSTGSPTWRYWSFGDGATSTGQNPSHTYLTAGTYTVTLTVGNANGRDTESKAGYITVSPADRMAANFTANITSGKSPLPVRFTDTSTGSPTSWLWKFGDGTTSTEQNPVHTYTSRKWGETYTVSLTITGAGGKDTETKIRYITIKTR